MKKIVSSILVTAMTASLITGCGASNDKVEEVKKTGSNDQVKTEEKVDLNLYFRSTNADYAQQVVDAYEAENQNVDIELIKYPNTDYKDKLMVQLAGGGDVDIYDAGNSAWFGDFVSKKQALQLDDLIARDNFDIAPYGNAIEELLIDNKLYTLPVVDSLMVLYYNKDLFDQAGVSYPTEDMTWNEFRELAKTMTSGEGNDKIWGSYIHTWPQCWYGIGLQEGATIIDKDLTPIEKALQFRVDLEEDGSIMPYTESIATNAHYNAMFQSGKLAMSPIGSWHIGQLRVGEAEGNVNFDWDVVPMPHPEGVSPNTTWGMTGQVVIQPDTKHVEEAWDFLKYLCGEEGAKIFSENGVIAGYKTDEIRDIYVGDKTQKPENIDILFNQKVYLENPAIPGIEVVKTEIIDKESQLTFAGERSVEDTMKAIKERIEKEFNN